MAVDLRWYLLCRDPVVALFINVGVGLCQAKRKAVEGSVEHEAGHNPLADHKDDEIDFEVRAGDVPIQPQGCDGEHGLQIKWTVYWMHKSVVHGGEPQTMKKFKQGRYWLIIESASAVVRTVVRAE